MNPLAGSTIRTADALVLVAYCTVLIVTGIIFARRSSKTTNEYFLAARRMPMWAVAVSIIATSLSAATFIGAPEQSYKGDCAYLSTNIGGLIGVIVVAAFFIPAFYRHNVTTIYELLERRYGSGAKRAASAAFMVGRVFASGARIYIGAIPFAMILFGPAHAAEPQYLIICIALMCLVGVLYTLAGGIASVIWTDVIQTCVLVCAVLAAIGLLLARINMPIGEIWRTLSTAGPGGTSKLTVFKSGLEPFKPGEAFTVLTAITGFALLNIASYGTDHDMVQRMLTCKNAAQGSRSVLFSMAIGIPLVTMFLVVGLLLSVFYNATFVSDLQPIVGDHSGVDPVLTVSSPPPSDKVFLNFIMHEMPPGLAGLMLAGLFAAGIGSLTSAINAMAATFIKDFYTRWAPNRAETHYLSMSRFAVAGWGFALGAFAVLCVFWKASSPNTTLIGLALSVMTFAYAGLLAVFITALFTRRGSTTSVIAALLTGFLVIALLQGPVWRTWTGTLFGAQSRIATLELAFPWHMTIGTILAFTVCCLGRSRRGGQFATPGVRTCESCGFELTGLDRPTCPECGGLQNDKAPPSRALREIEPSRA